MTLREAKACVAENTRRYPHLADDFAGLWELCVAEIDEGGSTQREIDSLLNDMEDLIVEWSEISAS